MIYTVNVVSSIADEILESEKFLARPMWVRTVIGSNLDPGRYLPINTSVSRHVGFSSKRVLNGLKHAF